MLKLCFWTAGTFVTTVWDSGDPFFDRFGPPCLLGCGPAGRAETAAGGNLDLVPSQEAVLPKSKEKWVPGAVCDCDSGSGAAKLCRKTWLDLEGGSVSTTLLVGRLSGCNNWLQVVYT
jgi:hypothetical protein